MELHAGAHHPPFKAHCTHGLCGGGLVTAAIRTRHCNKLLRSMLVCGAHELQCWPLSVLPLHNIVTMHGAAGAFRLLEQVIMTILHAVREVL